MSSAFFETCRRPIPYRRPPPAWRCRPCRTRGRAESRERIAATVRERSALAKALNGLKGVVRVYSSEGNFLLVRFARAEAAFQHLLARGVVVRDLRAMPQLDDALRISVGTPDENQAVIAALREAPQP